MESEMVGRIFGCVVCPPQPAHEPCMKYSDTQRETPMLMIVII